MLNVTTTDRLGPQPLLKHQDLVELIRAGVPGPGGVWADLGSGDGAFTSALAELVGASAMIALTSSSE